MGARRMGRVPPGEESENEMSEEKQESDWTEIEVMALEDAETGYDGEGFGVYVRNGVVRLQLDTEHSGSLWVDLAPGGVAAVMDALTRAAKAAGPLADGADR